MNQAIQFPDREEWRTDVNAVVFPAMVHGMQLTCAISERCWRPALAATRLNSGWKSFNSIAGIWKKKLKD